MPCGALLQMSYTLIATTPSSSTVRMMAFTTSAPVPSATWPPWPPYQASSPPPPPSYPGPPGVYPRPSPPPTLFPGPPQPAPLPPPAPVAVKAPSFSRPPTSASVNQASLDVSFTLDTPGKVYFAIVPDQVSIDAFPPTFSCGSLSPVLSPCQTFVPPHDV